MVREIVIDHPITCEGQPDGGRVPIVDPYDGCQLACPYCFQLCDEGWNKEILVKTNIAGRLGEALTGWNQGDTIYVGSRCDPYMPLEGKYALTRACLEVLHRHGVSVMITTKAAGRLIFRDLELLKGFADKLTVLMGLANVKEIAKGAHGEGIRTANELTAEGIAVWAFLTPVLPYMMNAEEMISALHPSIPVFLDKLRVFHGTRQKEELRRFIGKCHPDLAHRYEEILSGGDEEYFETLKKQYVNDARVKILF